VGRVVTGRYYEEREKCQKFSSKEKKGKKQKPSMGENSWKTLARNEGQS